jgi:hypothetical protein
MLAASQFFAAANYAEACLWAVIAIGFAAHAAARPARRRTSLLAAVAFLAFGLSDIVEARSGAWWRPWWLLAWKGVSLVVFAWLLRAYVRARRDAAVNRGTALPATATSDPARPARA